MVQEARIRHLIGVPPRDGAYVLYWMQQAQRTEYNHALAFAVQVADELALPIVVGFVLIPDFPQANLRHYQFMLEGIADVQASLEKIDVPFIIVSGEMVASVVRLSEKAAWVVTDVGYLKIQRKWREQVGESLACPFTAVETDVIVPVSAASAKEETAARTLRPKILKLKDKFLESISPPHGRGRPNALPEGVEELVDPLSLLSKIPVETSVSAVSAFKGGQQAAKIRLSRFVDESLEDYEESARNPVVPCQSDMSPYLHFGQISPAAVYKEVSASDAPDAAKWAFLEQLLVRRELSVNFVYYNSGYDRYETAVPRWARESLQAHRPDPRPYHYSRDQFEQAATHDPYWNAAQTEMVVTGKMHNYMRMYWGKKIIEWTEDPVEAFDLMLSMNNKYELDGRDPNSFTGVSWCFGRHDRGWQERQIFSKVRYMNARGLERKFRIARYVERVNVLTK